MTTFVQRSFSGGEISPSLYSRVDAVKYSTGLRQCRNTILLRHGGSASRPGTTFVGEVKDSTKATRLVPFVFNTAQSYILELGELTMRFIQNGSYVRETAKNITAISQANPAVVTSNAHGYANGNQVYLSGIGGMTRLNNRTFIVAGVTANTYQLKYLDGTNVDSLLFSAYTSGGTSARVYTLTTPWDDADLMELQFVQSADVMTFVHPSYRVYELSRLGQTNWTLTAPRFKPGIERPNALTATAAAGATTFRYKVTSISSSGEESLPGLSDVTVRIVSSVTQANPPVVTTATPHGYLNGEEVFFPVTTNTMVEIQDRAFVIANKTATTFELEGIDGTGFHAFGGGTQNVYATHVTVINAAIPVDISQSSNNSGAVQYYIYKEINNVYGFVGVMTPGINGAATFRDAFDPDVTQQPPMDPHYFYAAGEFPSAITYFQQRLFLANSNNEIETVWASQTGYFKNFDTHVPLQASDSIKFALAGKQVNEVRHLIDIGKLIVFSTAGEWAIDGNEAGVILPTAVNARQHSYNGASILPPLVLGGNALFVQARGSIVRDLGFDYQSDGYRGNDLTIFAAHLVDGFELLDWTYQQTPHSIVWSVRDDGTLLGLTYVREQEIIGWHRHDFDGGTVLNVCAIPEGDEDALYVVVSRTIGSRTVKYVERLATRRVDDIVDYIGMDSTLSYDGRNTNTVHTMTLSGSGWTHFDTLTLTSSASFFTAADVGNEIQLTGSDDTLIRFTITGFTSGTVVTGTPNKDVPLVMHATAISSWARAVDTVSALDHIEGLSVSVLGDGFVVASPNNESYNTVTVANGAITLDRPYAVIHVGLPFISDMETLDIDTANGETISDKKKLIGGISVFLEKSRGLWVGPRPPTDDDTDPLENLYELKVRSGEGYDDPVELATSIEDVIIKSDWESNGRVFMRQVDPVPLSILAVAPAGLYPFRGQ